MGQNKVKRWFPWAKYGIT